MYTKDDNDSMNTSFVKNINYGKNVTGIFSISYALVTFVTKKKQPGKRRVKT